MNPRPLTPMGLRVMLEVIQNGGGKILCFQAAIGDGGRHASDAKRIGQSKTYRALKTQKYSC